MPNTGWKAGVCPLLQSDERWWTAETWQRRFQLWAILCEQGGNQMCIISPVLQHWLYPWPVRQSCTGAVGGAAGEVLGFIFWRTSSSRCSLVPWCSPILSRQIKADKVQTHNPAASFVTEALVFGTGASETEGMLTSEITTALHQAWNLLKPCVVLIKVWAVELIPVAWLLLQVPTRWWSCCTSCCSPRESRRG